jgi:hypothetical protein
MVFVAPHRKKIPASRRGVNFVAAPGFGLKNRAIYITC